MKLTVATCQFPVSADIRANQRYILRQMATARKGGATVAHFPECALSGYAETDFTSTDALDWAVLDECMLPILARAGELGLWVVLGSTHRLSDGNKPHNSLFIIDAAGRLIDRYDKRFCAGTSQPEPFGDLANYSPGDHPTVFTINGVRCAVLVCHEYRYPELYRELGTNGAQVVFHSFNAGHVTPERYAEMSGYVGRHLHRLNRGSTLPEITMIAALHAGAADNHVYISASNTSAPISCWPSFFVRPDGVITGRLRRHVPGVLITTIDTGAEFYDSTVNWRERAKTGIFHSGELVSDPRSAARTNL